MNEHPLYGRPVGEHSGRFGAGGWLWYIGGILVAAGVMNTGQGALALFGGAPDALTKIGMGVVAGAIGAAILLVAVMRWRQHVVVYERGLVYAKLLGQQQVAFADVTRVELVREHSKMGTDETIHIALRDGREVSIGSVTNIDQLAG
ncbi:MULTISPECIES: hypothetical protein [Sandaracinus]|uniref:hypothetical protein n=1 Tax=Sandaracinus TaxID=1055688 RepID=UPI0019D415EB|nr:MULTISPECIES: hypothetical protein [Sandaracinus]QRN75794.1 Hypothetical protein MSR10575_88810 [Sandaracinus sp.]UJR87313.1 Hypothetical protein I5071_1050 [Sandaracinus amylolyticus]